MDHLCQTPRPVRYRTFILILLILVTLPACASARPLPKPPTITAVSNTGTPADQPSPPTLTLAPSPTLAATADPAHLAINFDNLPEGVPPDWKIFYAPFDAGSQPPNVTKAQAQANWFMIENQGTFSGLYALYTRDLASPDLQISLDTLPDGQNPIGVFLVCRYSDVGWYQFRISSGGSSVQLVRPQGQTFNAGVLAEGPGVFLDDGAHRLTGICDQNQLTLLADGREILSKEADFLPTGTTGFGVESFDAPGARKAFDNVEIQLVAKQTASASAPSPTQLAPTSGASTQVAALPATATQVPTLTPTPTTAPTLRPTPIPEGELNLYKTEFDAGDASLANWKTFAYSFATHGFVTDGYKIFSTSGTYIIRASNPNQGTNLRVFSIYDTDLGTPDVNLALRAKAPYDYGSAGLVCRYTDAGWYQFMVEPRGVWSIRLAKFDAAGQLHFHTVSEGQHWLEPYVELRAECKGDRLTFSIDGTVYASLHDSTFPTGKVGLLGWSFDQPGDISLIDRFTVQRAQWSESAAPGPAPTPGADSVIYHTDFARPDDLTAYWTRSDAGVIGLPGTSHLYGGPGSTEAPHTIRYFNDFDPGPDVEISADIRGASLARGLICRYSEDGWYQAHYESIQGGYAILVRMERDALGQLTSVTLGAQPTPTGTRINLSLKCAGNQISVAVNGTPVIAVQDTAWPTGRYGLMYLNNLPASLTNAFVKYTVRQASRVQPGEVLSDERFDTPEEIISHWNLDASGADPRVIVQDSTVVLAPISDALHPFIATTAENVELSLKVEFLAAADIILHCRSGSANIGAEIRNNGDWSLSINFDQRLDSGNSPSITADKNHLSLKCMNSQITLVANGETLAQVELPNYLPAIGTTGFDVLDGSKVKVNNLALKVWQSPDQPRPLLNQVAIPAYAPGDAIYTLVDVHELSYNPGWWEMEKDRKPWLWALWYHGEKLQEQDNRLTVTPRQDWVAATYRAQDLYDLPVAMTATVAFTGKSGGIGLFCRHTAAGRYEFLIRPDGQWSIRRDRSEWFAPSAQNMTVIAHGTSTAILPATNQLSAVCEGNTLILSANGTELGRAQDDLYPEGQIGFSFDSFTGGSVADISIARR